MSIRNPKAVLTPVGKGPSPRQAAIASGPSRPTLARSFIDEDLAYIRSLGPGPLPWERRRVEVTMPANTPTVPPHVD